jgi:hypothetical protein
VSRFQHRLVQVQVYRVAVVLVVARGDPRLHLHIDPDALAHLAAKGGLVAFTRLDFTARKLP